MAGNEDDRFRITPAAPKSRGGPRSQRFVSQVLKQVSKTGAKHAGKSLGRPANTFGRGRVAASMAGRRLGPNARRVVIKSRFVVLRRASPNSVAVHLRYIERDGVTRDGQKGRAYGADTDAADLKTFQERGQNDRHQFRFIVSPEDGLELEDLRGFTRQLMRRMEIDLETPLDWAAVDHWDTDNPHTHIVLNGHTGGPADGREDLVIAPDYMANGMRQRASEIATDWLGPRTEAEIRQSLLREIDQQRLTGLDRALIRQAGANGIDLAGNPQDRQRQNALRARLQRLEGMGLAERMDANRWKLKPGMAATLDAMGQREDALETVRRALRGQRRECVVDERLTSPVIGRIAGKGLTDELHDRGYMVVDGIDGRAHYLNLPAGTDLAELPVHRIVEARPPGQERRVDRHIATVARDGFYKTADHLTQLKRANDRDPQSTVDAHVRRLEALRRAGIVERIADGVWKVPPDLLHKTQQHDAQKADGLVVELRSHLPLDQQVRAIGATWLDKQLVSDGVGLVAQGFGGQVREAMHSRVDFLATQGLAEWRDQRAVLATNLLATLRAKDLAAAGKVLAEETGQAYRVVQDGGQASGIYRRSIQLVSGRFAMLDNGMGFTLVPWRPVVEPRLGQHVSAIMRGQSIAWQLGRARSIAI
ncbi:MAG: conjugal transfer protein [Ramlibacter sp.]|nr:conjugal transfer protein [Ramlibacter sp.]